MKVLLLGASGQLGKSLKQVCPKKIELHTKNKKQLDITDFELSKKIIYNIKPDFIINTAAYTNVDKAEENEKTVNKINCDAVYNLAIISKNINCCLIHFSTDYVFDGKKSSPYNEKDTTKPLSIYGKSKLEGENKICETLIKYYIFRVSWLFSNENNNFILKILSSYQSKNNLKVVFDQIGQPLYTIELSKIIWKIIEVSKMKKNYGIYHISGKGEASSRLEIAYLISKYLQQNKFHFPNIIPIKSYEYKNFAKRPFNSTFDTSKIYNVFKPNQIDWKLNMISVINKHLEIN